MTPSWRRTPSGLRVTETCALPISDRGLRTFLNTHFQINGVAVYVYFYGVKVIENVVRRELRTKPGDLFSKEALERSYREIAQMGHFNPENIQPDVQPDPTNGTVDINWNLESKANDQVEFSAGWGQTGVIGKLSLKFTNFSMANLFHKSDNYRWSVR